MKTKKFHVQAHRGACVEKMENTLQAFEVAASLGVDSIELDVHLSSDGKVIVVHDPILDSQHAKALKTSTPVIQLESSTLTSLEYLVPRRLVPQRSVGKEEGRIPQLSEVASLLKNKGPTSLVLDIEMKRESEHPELSASPEDFAKAVLDIVDTKWDRKRTVIRSFDLACLVEVRKRAPSLSLAFITENGVERLAEVQAAVAPVLWAPRFDSLDSDKVQLLQRAGLKVIPWTVNQKDQWKRAIEMGLDGVTTDNPRGLLAYLNHPS